MAIDGLSLLFLLLSGLLGLVAVLASWRETEHGVGLHYLCLLAALAGINGVFLARDMVLFYFFWELMLVPTYFLIGTWGNERRIHAAVKFLLFTVVSGLFLLLAILGLYAINAEATGELSMAYADLLRTPVRPEIGRWLFLGMLFAFGVKLPLFPFHSWLPDAHAEAPTAGSILLAGLLLNTGGYGLIRFAFPLFSDAARDLSWLVAILAVISIVYGAVLALGQSDLKRVIAYLSISHMGFVMLGVASWNLSALQGSVVQMVAHGIAIGALFAAAGMVKERVRTAELTQLGELWPCAPRLSALTLLFVLASVGLPGMGNFVGKFLVLLGSFRTYPWLVTIAAIAVVAGTAAALMLMQRVFLETRECAPEAPDLSLREGFMLGVLALVIVAIGLLPQPLLNTASEPLEYLLAAGLRFDPIDPDLNPGADPNRSTDLSMWPLRGGLRSPRRNRAERRGGGGFRRRWGHGCGRGQLRVRQRVPASQRWVGRF